MKKVILLFLCIIGTYVTQAQIKLKPKWTTGTGYAGKETFFNKDGTRMLTASLGGVSVWNTVRGEVMYTIPYYTVQFGGVVVNKDFSLFAFVARPNGGDSMFVKVYNIESGDSVAIFTYPQSLNMRANLAFNNSNTRLVLATEKGDVVIWDLMEHKQICSVKGKGNDNLEVKFIGETNKIVTTSWNGEMKVIDTDGCLVLDSLQKFQFDVVSDVSSDGARVFNSYISPTDGKVKNIVMNTADGSIINIPEELSKVWSRYAKLSHDGTKIALVQDSMLKFTRVKIWDLISGKIIHSGLSKCEAQVDFYIQDKINAQFNETGDQFVMAGMNGTTVLHDIRKNNVLLFEGIHKQWHTVHFMGNSNKIVTSSDDGMIAEWDIETQKALRYFWGAPYLGALTIYLTSDERYIIASAINGPIALIERKTGKLHEFLLNSPWASINAGRTIMPCKDPSKIMLYDGFTSVKKLDIITGETIFDIISDDKSDTIYKWQVPRTNHAFYNEENNQIIVAFGAQTNVHDAMTGKKLFAMKGHLGEPFAGTYYDKYTDFVYSTSYNKIMTGGTDYKLRIWSATTGELLNTFESSSFHRSLAFCKNQDIILIGNLLKREIYKWDLSTMSLMQTFSPIKIEADRAFSSDLNINTDETLLVTSTRDEFCILDFNNGNVLWRDTLSRWIEKVKFSRKSDLVAVGDFDGKIYIYNVNDGTLKFELIGHGESVFFMQFCDNDSTLLTHANDGTIKLWNLWVEDGAIPQLGKQNKVPLRITNPVQNDLQLFVDYPLLEGTEYTIINNIGDKVRSGILKSGYEKYTIPVHNLSGGIYVFSTVINGKRVQEKFIVTR